MSILQYFYSALPTRNRNYLDLNQCIIEDTSAWRSKRVMNITKMDIYLCIYLYVIVLYVGHVYICAPLTSPIGIKCMLHKPADGWLANCTIILRLLSLLSDLPPLRKKPLDICIKKKRQIVSMYCIIHKYS